MAGADDGAGPEAGVACGAGDGAGPEASLTDGANGADAAARAGELGARNGADGADGAEGADGADDAAGWFAEIAEIRRRRELALAMGGPDKVRRQVTSGRLTVRERIDRLADAGSFAEIGVLTGFGDYDADGRLVAVQPANFVAGTASVGGRRVMIGADDFTVRGGSGDAAIHAKQIYSEQYAADLRLPVIRLLDGASGGGSVKSILDSGYTYVPVNPAWDAVVGNLSLVPVVAACLGPVVGLGAGRLVMSHLAVMVTGIGQLFTAGPPVVRGGTGEDLTKEELGGSAVHRRNATIERFASAEDEAFAIIRGFLSYLPASVHEIPPVQACDDPAGRRDESLATAVPRSPRLPYRIGPVLDAIFDRGSVFSYAEYGGATVTALARLDGRPVGVLATDPYRGTTMSLEGAQAITRLVDLCETFHLPIVSLTDQGGITIGRVAEERGTIRYAARAIASVYQARVPQAELIVRRVYGVGRRGDDQPAPGRPQLGLAIGRLGLAAGPGRRRGGIPRRARGCERPGRRGRAHPPHAGRPHVAVPDR